jgi:hypothetical protein
VLHDPHRGLVAVFNPADEKLAAQLFREHAELTQIEHAVLLAFARRHVASCVGKFEQQWVEGNQANRNSGAAPRGPDGFVPY